MQGVHKRFRGILQRERSIVMLQRVKRYTTELILLLFGGVASAMIYLVYTDGVDFADYYTQHIDAIMVVKQETTLSHLWFEERMSGDQHEGLDKILGHLDQSDWYIQAMLKGGRNREGYFPPVRTESIREQLEMLERNLRQFRTFMLQRENNKENNQPGTTIDQAFDRLFGEIMDQAEGVEQSLRSELIFSQNDYRLTLWGVITLLLVSWVITYSSIKRINRRLLKKMKQAKAADRAKSDFLASMSHELRTPLTTIIGQSEFLMEQLHDSEHRKMLRVIEAAGENQLALVNDILDMSKIESGNFTIESHPYDLSHIMEELELMFSNQMEKAGLRFEVKQRLQPEFMLLGDHQRIKQIAVNLLSNALKFTEKGHVLLTTWSSGSMLHFSVEDSGIGINDELKGRLFQRFQQGDSSISRSFGGTGLGLCISKRLAQMMGGTIEAESESGRGSTFRVDLPLELSNVPVIEGEHRQDLRRSIVINRFKGRVLVVEDTPELQMLITKMLEVMGIESEVAANGVEALECATQRSFDLILMDMQMPVMDGVEATSRLRAAGNQTPVIALTANVMEKHRKAFEEVGANGFLTKPIQPSQFRLMLSEYLKSEDPEEMVAESVVDPVLKSKDSVIDGDLSQLFIQRMHELKLDLSKALSKEDWEEVGEIAHVIKGSATSFGYAHLSHVAAEIGDAIDKQQTEQISSLTLDLLFKLSRILH